MHIKTMPDPTPISAYTTGWVELTVSVNKSTSCKKADNVFKESKRDYKTETELKTQILFYFMKHDFKFFQMFTKLVFFVRSIIQIHDFIVLVIPTLE